MLVPSEAKRRLHCPLVVAICGVLLSLLGGCSEPDMANTGWPVRSYSPYSPRPAYRSGYTAPRPTYNAPLYVPSAPTQEQHNPQPTYVTNNQPPQPPEGSGWGWLIPSANAAPAQPQPRPSPRTQSAPAVVRADPTCGWWDLAHIWGCPQ